MDTSPRLWYVVQQKDGTCEVINLDASAIKKTPEQKQWGSYNSEQEAIAKKTGLIRAGKCKPQIRI